MNTNRCEAKTKSGQPCNAKAGANGFCSIHSTPGRAAELGRISGESRRSSEECMEVTIPRTAEDVKIVLGQVLSQTAAGKISTKLGTSLAYIASVFMKAVEASDYEVRLEAIEQIMCPRIGVNKEE